MTDYLASVPLCATSQAYCNSSHSTVVSILIKIPVRFDQAHKWSVRQEGYKMSALKNGSRWTRDIKLSMLRDEFPQLEGLVGTRARSASDHVESQQSLLRSWIIYVQVVLYSALMPSQLAHPKLIEHSIFPHSLFEELSRERFVLCSFMNHSPLLCFYASCRLVKQYRH